MLMPNPWLLWAKLPRDGANRKSFHPLLCHMLDVAASARVMWRQVISEQARQQVAESFQLSSGAAELWVTFLAALHDLGKASPAFQLRKEARHLFKLYESLGRPPAIEASECPHGRVTAGELPQILITEFQVEAEVANRLSVIIGGHHGTFPTSYELENRYRIEGVGKGVWHTLRRELTLLIGELLHVRSARVPAGCNHATAMLIAGLVSVADWIGSNNEFFAYMATDYEHLPATTPAEYLMTAEANAEKALRHLGWMGWRQPDRTHEFEQLFPAITLRRPLQDVVIEVAEKLAAPAIVIVEAPMGEGKTEAALYLSDRWGVAPGPRGFYIALPTQATSNQMFSRTCDFLGRRYSQDKVNVQLLHGHAALSAEFEELKRNGWRAFTLGGVYGADECGTHGTSVAAAEWFTHRKRGLLAPFGVGTIDQALLAVLQTRHVFVRLFGLAHKTVIIDEVHAYDAYMSKLLERLLEWLAALGSPVVLLSATLPQIKQKALLEAYLRGLNGSFTPDDKIALDVNYPRVCFAGKGISGAKHVAVSAQSQRQLKLEWVEGQLPQATGEDYALGEKLRAALHNGGCAAIICNTVRRAQEVYLALKPYFTASELDLFHARYLFKDREEREKRVLVRFGKQGSRVVFDNGLEQVVKRPNRAVLVATQVIEQSLDLDFDLMVSDLAPVDLVLQRSGRLHRHARQADQPRPTGLTEPTLWLAQPEQVSDGVPVFDRGTGAVYDAHILLRSWLALREYGENKPIRVPAEIEDLIEQVYGSADCPADMAENLRRYWEATAQELADALRDQEFRAAQVRLPEPHHPDDILDLQNKRLEEDEPEIHQSLQALTRLTEPTVSVICLMPGEQGEFGLNAEPSIQEARRLLRRSVTLSDKRIVWTLLKQSPSAAWAKSALLRRYRLLRLDEHGCWTDGRYQIQLHPDLGITVTDIGKEAQ